MPVAWHWQHPKQKSVHRDALIMWCVHECPDRGASIVSSTVKEAVQMIREYLKDEPWLTLLCKKLQ
jgi:hypothetical protein